MSRSWWRRGALVLLSVLLLANCDSVRGILGTEEDESEILPGERIPVMLLDSQVTADTALDDLEVLLPPPQANSAWPTAGGRANNAMHHLALGPAPAKLWEADIGDGAGGEQRLLATPVIADGKVFTIDSEGLVSAFDAESGGRLWEAEVLPEDDEEGDLSGGIAYLDGRLFVGTGAAETIAYDAATGQELWRKRMPGPVRAAPTPYAGRVFVVTIDSQLVALDARDGRELWTHAGIAELASILGYASPAAEGNTLIVVYPSGEIVAFRIDTGRQVWSDSITSLRRVDALSSLSTIRGQPVIYDDQVYVIGHGGRMVAIDLRTGNRAWEQNFGGIMTPWVAGDWIYVITLDNELVCLSRRTGGVKWVRPLPLYNDPEDQDEPILWTGPALAGDRLIVAGDNGIIASFSPYDSELLGTLEFDDNVTIAPVIANNTVYFLTDDGELVAYR